MICVGRQCDYHRATSFDPIRRVTHPDAGRYYLLTLNFYKVLAAVLLSAPDILLQKIQDEPIEFVWSLKV